MCVRACVHACVEGRKEGRKEGRELCDCLMQTPSTGLRHSPSGGRYLKTRLVAFDAAGPRRDDYGESLSR